MLFMLHSVVTGRQLYRQALEESMSGAITDTMSEIETVEQRNEFIAVFLQKFIQNSDADVDMTVQVISADQEKGLLDIQVIERPVFFSFWHQEVSVRKTVVFDKKIPAAS